MLVKKNRYNSEDNSFPVKLKELKAPLQIEANEQDRSLHYWIRKILKEHLNKKK